MTQQKDEINEQPMESNNNQETQEGENTHGEAQSNDVIHSDCTIKNEDIVQNDFTVQSEDIAQYTVKSEEANQDEKIESNQDEKIESKDVNFNNVENNSETQKNWQLPNINNGGNQGFNGINNNYYKENYRKTNNKKSDAWKYILVSLVSAIIGGSILSIMILGIGPIVQPQLKSFFGIEDSASNNTNNTGSNISEMKKIEIVQSGESAVTSVAEKVGPSVVGIRTKYQITNEFFGESTDGGEGSGIVISSDGYILTNHHVIENALNDKTRDIRKGAQIEVYLANKIDKPYTATIKGYDSKADLAVLKINETNLTVIEFGDSDSLKVGEPAIAFGNPGGLEYMGSLTSGVISGLNRTVQLDGGRKIKLVQTDAAINPGNSGGALVNIKGQLIGVNTIKMVATGFEGLGFAIPVNDAKRISDELIKNTYISKPYLGITVGTNYNEEFAKTHNLPIGVFVNDVEILGPAQKAGIKALDIITKFNKVTVTSFDDLESEKNKFKAGDVVEVELYRDDTKKTLTVQVKLGETK